MAAISLRFVYGRAGTGKSEFLLADIAGLHRAGERCLLLVPEQYSHMAETSLITKIGYLSADVQVLSFRRMAANAMRDCGYHTPRLDASGRSMLICRVLAKLGDALGYYGAVRERAGFVSEVSAFFTELKKSGITAEEFARHAAKQPGVLGQKLADLTAVYGAYTEELAGRYLDADDSITVLTGLIERHALFSDTHVYIDEFARMTAQELLCVRALLATGAQVTVALTTDTLSPAEADLFAPAARTASQLMGCAREVGTAIRPPIHLTEMHRFAAAEDLAHLERGLYAYPAKPYLKAPAHISLFAASNPYTEVTALAAHIHALVRKEGLHFRDVAVIAGDFEGYRDLIRTVFPRFGIPVFTDQKTELLQHPILRLVTVALDMVTENFRTEDVLAYLKSGYAGLSPAEVDAIENRALTRAIERGDWLDDSRFRTGATDVLDVCVEEDSAEIQTIIQNKNRALAPVLALKQALSQDRTVTHRVSALSAFLEDIALPAQLEAQIAFFTQAGDMQHAGEYADVYNTLLAVLEQLVTCLGPDKLGLRQLKTVLESGFAEQQLGLVPPSLDEVFLGDLSRSKVKNVRALFVVGASGNTFPPPIAAGGLLTDQERITLTDGGLPLAPDARVRTLDARMEVYQAVTLATEWLFVSWPIADADGHGLRPSPLVTQMTALFPNATVTDNLLETHPRDAVDSPESAYFYVLPHLAAPEASYRTTAAVLAEDPAYREKLARARGYRAYRNEVNPLSPALATALYGTELHGSVSRFERYTACPYSYFLQYGLKARERRVLRLSPPDIGRLLHTVVDQFTRQLLAEGISFATVTEAECQTRITAIVDALTSAMYLRRVSSANKVEALLARLRRLVFQSVWALCEHVRAGRFEPCASEFTFDENGDIPPVTLDLPTGERITLTGRIDRIDKCTIGDTVYVKIIDYKSGIKTFSLSDVYQKLDLQLAVYIHAVWENGRGVLGENVRPAGMFYFRLADPMLKTNGILPEADRRAELLRQFKLSGMALADPAVLEALGGADASDILPVSVNKDGSLSKASSAATMEQFSLLRAHIARTIGEIGQEILHGSVQLRPCKNGNQTACDHCPFGAICQFDPNRQPYHTITSYRPAEVWEKLAEE